ncbi:MAG: hypothetical protein JXA22_04495 [Candidatus Thermoplasmatota archaeon]|nr:hypothetical protein [Candidatus Thermoplasmatota archaeon]
MKISPVSVFDTLERMQATLKAIKWEGGENKILHEEISEHRGSVDHYASGRSRDSLRRYILKVLDRDMDREHLLTHLIEEGYDRVLIEDVIEELLIAGLLHYPSYEMLRKS